MTDLRQAFFDDADLTGSVGLEETQFNELKPRKMKPFVLHKMTVLKFVKSILPSSVPDDADDLDEDSDDDEGDEDDEPDDKDEEEDEDEEDDGDDEADDDDDGDMDDAEEEGDNVEDDEGEGEEEGGELAETDEEGSPKAGGESDLAASAAAKGASDQAKQQLLRAKKADRDRLELFRAQEDTLIQECKSRRVDQYQPAR